MNNVVRFVRLQKPVCDLLGTRAPGDETARQHAAERLRTLVLKTNKLLITDQLRIIPVPQSRLWQEGVAARKLLKNDAVLPANGDDGDKDDAGHEPTPIGSDAEYAAGKWGRFLRAPEIYFRLLEKYGNRFVKLGEIADVKRGITSGCDAFFMPRMMKRKCCAQPPGRLGLEQPGGANDSLQTKGSPGRQGEDYQNRRWHLASH